MKKIAVYCGAATGNNPIYLQAAKDLGHWLVKNDYGLTYGGGRLGLMGALADTVLEDGGYVHGIITEDLANKELTHDNLSEIEIVKSIDERKEIMLKNSIASVALPGGPGTLEEMSDAFSWTRIGLNPDPCIYLNINHYYDPLLMMFNRMANEGFISEKAKNTLLFTESFDVAGKFIKNYVTPASRKYNVK
ncbi:TIGR00730 family Rossman fold protein [Companilactobacillus sp.]|jgi:uncharacterized protein (TIGR00730 family)|uniref:LOG family protein n=1 Tax=Companilactobacillus sp. TaxID=2767905 RepID=UPI0025BB37B8|nr:TIGR00730 family Rossman fold protein [Companilactobacillus sp.]MCH4008284.1 TIGR00730 family Rossman fold protein [Companilactobacillus sp.]MCH4051537.1 TIGR00730 family Rossman fold protein [Companilactobacillus sp.]MCH4076227.1 TIGR00730 family Rossman fold protein [Companilactobacillus sp.]MCH4124802.1 TIGR00730 family Rossman fold protein [Companilactobacillus sp.]MCH4131344.1 TIGR00730 family Rossman fold protein [Companilactobacillus sp.]